MVAFRVVTKALHLTARPRGRERRRGRECRRRRPEQNSPCWSDRRAVWRSRTGRARRLRQSARLRGAGGCRRSRWRDARRPVARWRGIGCQAGEPRAGAVLTNRQARRRSDGRPQGLVICAAVTHHRRPARIRSSKLIAWGLAMKFSGWISNQGIRGRAPATSFKWGRRRPTPARVGTSSPAALRGMRSGRAQLAARDALAVAGGHIDPRARIVV